MGMPCHRECPRGVRASGRGASGFWNRDEPKIEPECQNVLWPFVRLTLEKAGIPAVEGEEKVVGPDRCDFWVEFPRAGARSFRVGVELKTARASYGPPDLIDPIEDQLLGKYLRPSGCRHGIFVVLWFRDDVRYKGPSHWESRDSLTKDLRRKCDDVSETHRVSLSSYAIDLTGRFRKR